MKILDSLVEMVRVVHGVASKVARHDRDLAQQMKRASTSAALNGSEGIWAKAGKRRSRLEDAVNSVREALMALRIAGACLARTRSRHPDLWPTRELGRRPRPRSWVVDCATFGDARLLFRAPLQLPGKTSPRTHTGI